MPARKTQAAKAATAKEASTAPAPEETPAVTPEAPAEKPAKASKPAAKDSLIKTVSEVAALSEPERQAFRLAGGTTTNDPAE